MSNFDNDRRRLQGMRPLPPRFSSPGSAVMVGRVVSAAPAIGTFLLVNPVSVLGGEAEGAAGVTTPDPAVTVPVYLIGPGVPQTGDLLICRFVDFRWVAERTTMSHNPPNPCKCTWPRVLDYAGSVSQAQSAFYFVNSPTVAPEPHYTLTYGPRPADIPKDLQLLFFAQPGGVHDPFYVTMPDEAWFSPPIPCTVFGTSSHMYFYLWMQSCRANVMVIDAPYGISTYGAGQNSATKGAGNNVYNYMQTQCNPQFQMKLNLELPPYLIGTHGDDDLVPGPSAALGSYTNPRIGL